MSQHLEQQQIEQQTLTLNGIQVALARMLELPVADLSVRLENEMLDNPALEELPDGEEQHVEDFEDSTAEKDTQDTENDTSESEVYEPEQKEVSDEVADYLNDDDVPTYLQERYEAAESDYEIPVTSSISFYDALSEQVSELDLTAAEEVAMEYLIGSLDSDGFLRKDLMTLSDELLVYQNTEVAVSTFEKLLHHLQQFEPKGIGARSLQECLLLQISDEELLSPYKALAKKALEKYYKEFAAKHWSVLQKRMKLSDEEFEGMMHTLLHLNPKPGAAFNESLTLAAPTVVPDFFVENIEGELRVRLNHDGLPELRVSPAFKETVRQYRGKALNTAQEEAYIYARQKVEAAQGFINLVKRRNATLLLVMQRIVTLQQAFFLGDDDESLLRPLTLREVSESVEVDLSTVSRVTSSKYVQTLYGVYPLKYFFSYQIKNEEGDELSTRIVKTALRELIDNEDKLHPLSDEALSQLMKAKGFPIARRTVAKYRDQMGLPTQRLRKG